MSHRSSSHFLSSVLQLPSSHFPSPHPSIQELVVVTTKKRRTRETNGARWSANRLGGRQLRDCITRGLLPPGRNPRSRYRNKIPRRTENRTAPRNYRD